MTDYEKNLKRMLNAAAMEKVDKIPFSYSGSAYVAREQKLPMKDFISDYPRAVDYSV